MTDRSTYCHDWETFVKLIHAGRRIGVIPDYLFYYRRRADGMSAMMTNGGANTYPFIQRMITSFVARKRQRIEPGSADAVGGIGELFSPTMIANSERARSSARFHGAVRRLAAAGRRVWKSGLLA